MNFGEMHCNGANNHMNSKYLLGSIYLIFTARKQGKKLQKPEKCKGDFHVMFSCFINHVEIKCKFPLMRKKSEHNKHYSVTPS